MKILAIDPSVDGTGWAVFEDNELIEYGILERPKYPLMSKDRYPVLTTKKCKITAQKLDMIVRKVNPDSIVIEEVALRGKAGIKSIKGLVMLHGMILDRIDNILDLKIVKFISPREWRGKTGVSNSNRAKAKADSLRKVEEIFGIKLDSDDVAEAIMIGYSEIVDN